MTNTFKELALNFFRPLIGQTRMEDELSDPIPIRIPKLLLEEITAQSESIGGSRYRSKHLVNLLYLGSNYYRSNNEYVNSLSPEHYSLVTRLNYVFSIKELKPTVVAEELGHQDAQKVINWVDGKQFPEFKDLDQFSKKYFVDSDWLKHGNKSGNMLFTPYIVKHGKFHRSYMQMYIDLINVYPMKIETMRLIRSNKGSVLISLDYGNKKYMSVHYTVLRLDKLDSVGSTGFADLVGFASFCRLMDKYMTSILTISYNVSEKEFDLIATGQAIPDDLGIWGQSKANHWYETIHSEHDIKDHSDSDFWTGATKLFKSIQTDRTFEKNVSEMNSEENRYVTINNSYRDRYK